mgnify:CR=1 FL=1
MTEVSTDFSFMDERNYVHGTTLLTTMLDLLEKEAQGPVHLRRIKFQKEIHANGRIVVSRDSALASRFKEASCFMTCEVGGVPWVELLRETEERPVKSRFKSVYHIFDLIGDGKFGGTCRVECEDRAEIVRTLVEANKRFHVASLPPGTSSPKVRMGYIEDWKVPAAGAKLASLLAVRNVIARATPNGVTTLNRLTCRDPEKGDVSLLMCFDVDAGGRVA